MKNFGSKTLKETLFSKQIDSPIYTTELTQWSGFHDTMRLN